MKRHLILSAFFQIPILLLLAVFLNSIAWARDAPVVGQPISASITKFEKPAQSRIDDPLKDLATTQISGCLTNEGYHTSSVYDPCTVSGLISSRPIEPLRNTSTIDLEKPDLNAAYIKQYPRYDYFAEKNKHSSGDLVTFEAHIANRGGKSTGPFEYAWYIDDLLVDSGIEDSLAPAQMVTLSYIWTWQTGPHSISIILDPGENIEEASEQNNILVDRTNGLAVGFWVEQSVYDWFNTHQYELDIGSVSWEDWAQRQLEEWNRMFASAVHPLTPDGIIDRVRLDKVVVVPDGTLPCGNSPATEDPTVDLVWIFKSELVGVDSGFSHCVPFGFYSQYPQFLELERPLLHEMSHARYLVDLYGLDVAAHNAKLISPVSAAATTFPTDRDVESIGHFPVPVHLASGGELIVCHAKEGNMFKQCERGVDGTVARQHPINETVHLASVRIQDGFGNLIQGGEKLPYIDIWEASLYFNKSPNDLMSDAQGGEEYGQHSAYAWNRIAGKRPKCGNYNAPCNIGEYLDDLPGSIVIELENTEGQAINNAYVEIYRAKSFPGLWYGKAYEDPPGLTAYSDANGRATFGSNFFSETGQIVHTYGHSNGTVLVRITSIGESVYRFLEITDANEAYWAGNTAAVYHIVEDLPFYDAVTASFSASPLHGPPPLLVNFENLSTGDFSECTWDFGDGTIREGCDNTTHTYQEEGSYSISLTAEGLGGQDSMTKDEYIVVKYHRIFLPRVFR